MKLNEKYQKKLDSLDKFISKLPEDDTSAHTAYLCALILRQVIETQQIVEENSLKGE